MPHGSRLGKGRDSKDSKDSREEHFEYERRWVKVNERGKSLLISNECKS